MRREEGGRRAWRKRRWREKLAEIRLRDMFPVRSVVDTFSFFSLFFSFHDPSSISIVRVKYAKHNASDVRLSMTMLLRVPVHPFYTRQIYVPYVRYARTFARPIAFSSSSPLLSSSTSSRILLHPSIHPSLSVLSTFLTRRSSSVFSPVTPKSYVFYTHV